MKFIPRRIKASINLLKLYNAVDLLTVFNLKSFSNFINDRGYKNNIFRYKFKIPKYMMFTVLDVYDVILQLRVFSVGQP